MDISPINARVFEDVFGRMVATFAAELSTGDWSIFKTEKHIIMEISASPSFPSAFPSPPSPRASSSPEAHQREVNFKLESVHSITLDNYQTTETDSLCHVGDDHLQFSPAEGGDASHQHLSPRQASGLRSAREEDGPLDVNFSIIPESSFKDLDYASARSRSPRPVDYATTINGVDFHHSDDQDSTPPLLQLPPPPPLQRNGFVVSAEDIKPFVHPSGKAECRKCFKSFANTRHLTRHVKAIHLGLKHKCPYCGGLYARADGLRNHVNSIHLNDTPVAKRRCAENPAAEKLMVIDPERIVFKGEEKNGDDGGGVEGEMTELWNGPLSNDVDEGIRGEFPDESSSSTSSLTIPSVSFPSFAPKNRYHRQPRQEPVSAKRIDVAEGQSRFQCPYCLVDDFACCETLQLHLKESHRGKIHLCQVCLTLFLSPWKLKRHSESHRKKGAVGGDGGAGDAGAGDAGGGDESVSKFKFQVTVQSKLERD